MEGAVGWGWESQSKHQPEGFVFGTFEGDWCGQKAKEALEGKNRR